MIRAEINMQKTYTAKARNILDSQYCNVRSTSAHPSSSYRLQHWVDQDGNSYGQIDLISPFVEIIDITEVDQ